MNVLILIIVAFGASWLTFFSGFGLGTLLTPVFLLLFKNLELAVAGTAIVHFLNNVFKYLLMRRSVDWKIIIPFGLAAIPAAALGAYLLDFLSDRVLISYELYTQTYSINLFNLIFGVILIIFALIELIPSWAMTFSKQSLWFGGIISGFFGGLSGHQGALRTAFLIKYNLNKETFISCGIFIALIIDVVRTPIYFFRNDVGELSSEWKFITIGLLAALLGAITGKYFLKKIKFRTLNLIVAIAMLLFGTALIVGII